MLHYDRIEFYEGIDFNKMLVFFKLGLFTSKKIFVKLKFSPVLLEKIPSFVCLVFKIENK